MARRRLGRRGGRRSPAPPSRLALRGATPRRPDDVRLAEEDARALGGADGHELDGAESPLARTCAAIRGDREIHRLPRSVARDVHRREDHRRPAIARHAQLEIRVSRSGDSDRRDEPSRPPGSHPMQREYPGARSETARIGTPASDGLAMASARVGAA